MPCVLVEEVSLRQAVALGCRRQQFEVRRRLSESDQKNGGTNQFARRERLANYSPDFKRRSAAKTLGTGMQAPNMLVGLGERQKVQSAFRAVMKMPRAWLINARCETVHAEAAA
jgi:hypothetical protein